jgi:hypothetical protein
VLTRRVAAAATFLATFFTAEVAATASAYVPGIPSMEAELGNSHIISLLGISIYAFGFSLPPMGVLLRD